MDDIFAIQDEIALAITEKLKVTLFQDDRDKITKPYTTNTDAYELYLKGRFHMNRRGGSLPKGIECFEKAIETDADFALAYAGLADGLSLVAAWSLVPPKQVIQKVKQAADKAISLAPMLSEPYCSLAFYYSFFERNWEKAKQHFLYFY